jgi:epoxyqueuosine reductase
MCGADICSLSSRIREEAHRLGFLRIGIAPAIPHPAADSFDAWLERGFHGEMHYMERQAYKRHDPRRVLEEARSILVLAMNYHTGNSVGDAPMKGRISRYAWGEDYHLIIRDRLEQLLRFIQSCAPAVKGVCYTDTGPIAEKAWGAQASLGWIGKNTSLISQTHGSWFFIGVILLNLELEYDSPSVDHCGSCQRCLDACPTGAIVAPRILDARRCISYLTIELRGPILRELRPMIGNRIFGCDACQESCPWNRFAIKTTEKAFAPREGLLMPDLVPLVAISAEEFNRRFKDSPIRRATRDGLVRNVVLALGNSGSEEAVPVLAQALRDSSPLVRAHAAWALGRIRSAQACQILQKTQSIEKSPAVLEELKLALAGT